MSQRIPPLFLLLLVLLLAPLPVQGQVDVSSATLKGIVLDPLAAAVPGAIVTVTNTDRGITQKAVTDQGGTYQIPLLPPGSYRIEVAMDGFEKEVATGLELSVGASVIYDVRSEEHTSE